MLHLFHFSILLDYSEFFDPAKVHLPTSESEIVEIVETAGERGNQVRVLGSGHSRNALACSRNVILSLEKYKGVVSLDRQTQEVSEGDCYDDATNMASHSQLIF